jgi:hypothetical protein
MLPLRTTLQHFPQLIDLLAFICFQSAHCVGVGRIIGTAQKVSKAFCKKPSDRLKNHHNVQIIGEKRAFTLLQIKPQG